MSKYIPVKKALGYIFDNTTKQIGKVRKAGKICQDH